MIILYLVILYSMNIQAAINYEQPAMIDYRYRYALISGGKV